MNRILALVFVAVHVSAEGFAALVVGVTDQHLDPDHNMVEHCYVESLIAAGHVPVVVPCLTNDAAPADRGYLPRLPARQRRLRRYALAGSAE